MSACVHVGTHTAHAVCAILLDRFWSSLGRALTHEADAVHSGSSEAGSESGRLGRLWRRAPLPVVGAALGWSLGHLRQARTLDPHLRRHPAEASACGAAAPGFPCMRLTHSRRMLVLAAPWCVVPHAKHDVRRAVAVAGNMPYTYAPSPNLQNEGQQLISHVFR